MWAPDPNTQPVDPAGSAVAILPGTISVSQADGAPLARVKLVPYGAYKDNSGEGPWVLWGKEHALEVIVATREFQRSDRLLVDYDHATVLAPRRGSNPSGAIDPVSLTVEDDGIYGSIEWTPPADGWIRSKEWRYHAAHVRAMKSNGRITRLIGAGLTNTASAAIPAVPAATAALAARELTADERAICAAVGVSSADFRRQVLADAMPASAGALTAEELAICAATGVSADAFDATKGKSAREA